jgi:hypothetical protein
MRCPLVAYGMASRMQSAMQSTTQNIAAAHIVLVIRVYDEAGDVIETHEHAGEFK